MVWRCCGGMDERGSPVRIVDTGIAVAEDVVRGWDGREAVGVMAVGLSKADLAVLRFPPKLFILGPRGLGDFVGLRGGSGVDVVPRVVSHDLSSTTPGLNGRRDVCEEDEARCDGVLVGVDCLRGDPCGVGARIVEGERTSGDSGRRNGDARPPLLKERGAGLRGLEALDCFH
jgi:hypothetical protein